MNIILDKNNLNVLRVGSYTQPFSSNEILIENVDLSNISKQVQYAELEGKLTVDEKLQYILPLPDIEKINPIEKVIETTEVTDEPIMITQTIREPLLDESGNQVFYYSQIIRYEQVDAGTDENGDTVYETVEVIDVNDTPIPCYTTKEVQVQKETSNGEKLYYETVIEDEITYLPQEPILIVEDDERYVDGLEVYMESVEKVRAVKIEEEPELFTIEDLKLYTNVYEKILNKVKDDKIVAYKEKCEQTILDGFVSTLNGHHYRLNRDDQLNFVGQRDEVLEDETIAQVPWKTEDVGYILHTRGDFLNLYNEAIQFKKATLYKYDQLKNQINNCSTVEEVNAIVW